MSKSNKAELNSATLSIKTLLTWRGILQKDAAKALGITPPSLSNKLTGKIRFNDAEIFSLSHWLGVPSDALLGLKPLEVA
jgi:transcriptional regulator with XRE-family HTH domain